MMEHFDILVIALPFLFFSLVSARLDSSPFTAPMIFTGLGLLASPAVFDALHFEIGHITLHTIAEITLMLILFADAAHIRVRQLGRIYSLPMRLLLIGLPLMIVFGAGGAWLIYPAAAVWTLLLLAAICAPTDAALGQAVVSDKRVPERIRSTLSIESGLNDGLALPVILILIALAGASGGMMEQELSAGDWAIFGARQVVIGPLAGIFCGLTGGFLIRHAAQRGWLGDAFAPIAILMIAPISYALAEIFGGNGFLAAFCGGLAFGYAVVLTGSTTLSERFYEFTEAEGRLLLLLTFFLFGAAFAPDALANASWRDVLYGLLSLTIIRGAACALALAGTGLRWRSILFIGWFGPRGLASVLFALLVIQQSGFLAAGQISSAVTVTVLMSIILHGLSAQIGAIWYAGFCARTLTPQCPENQSASL